MRFVTTELVTPNCLAASAKLLASATLTNASMLRNRSIPRLLVSENVKLYVQEGSLRLQKTSGIFTLISSPHAAGAGVLPMGCPYCPGTGDGYF
jgi:hypothetical protein